jgi:PAS domain S-box-containing protein
MREISRMTAILDSSSSTLKSPLAVALAQAFAAAPNPVLMLDLEGRVLLWNEPAELSFGYSPENLRTLTDWFRACFPDETTRQTLERRWELAVSTAAQTARGVDLGEIEIKNRHGQSVPVELVLTVTEGHVIAFLHDLTEHNRAIEAIRESEERLSAAFAAFPEAIAIGSLKTGRYLLVNDGFTHVTGWPRDLTIGRTAAELNIWVAPDNHRTILDEMVKTSELKHFEAVFRRRDGSTFVGLISGRTITAAGETYILTIVRDTTHQRELEQKVQQAQRLESVGRLAGGVAHDFNNLLTCIIGNIEQALEGLPADAPVRQDLIATLDASERAAGVTRQLLAFGRRQVLAPESLSLNVIVTNLGKLLERLLGEDIEIHASLAQDLHLVRADALQIEQIILNLAVNARDAMPQGGKLTIETLNVCLDEEYASDHVGVKPGHHALLSVTDNGSGMSEETKAHIFEPFFTTKEVGKGTGLGLSTVYGIVAQSEGHITVYSEPGRGTTFRIYFPRDDSQPFAISQPPRSMTLPIGTETILVVEDDRQVRSILRRVLIKAGYSILLAENGAEALVLFAAHDGPIHLVVTDVVMPKMSGKELATQLAKQHPELKVLYMSGFTDDALGHHGVLQPGTPFIAKPFTAEQLKTKVRHVLDGRS